MASFFGSFTSVHSYPSRYLDVRTIKVYLAVIAFSSKVQGFPEHTGDFYLLCMLEGWAQETPSSFHT